MFWVSSPIEDGKNKVLVPIQFSEGIELDLLEKGRVRDALALMNDLERAINDPEWTPDKVLKVVGKIKTMASYNPNNK